MTIPEIEEYSKRVAKKFFAKYTDQFEETVGEWNLCDMVLSHPYGRYYRCILGL